MYSERSLGLTQSSGFPWNMSNSLERKTLPLLLSLLASQLPCLLHTAMIYTSNLSKRCFWRARFCLFLIDVLMVLLLVLFYLRWIQDCEHKATSLSQWCKSSTKSCFTLVLCQNNCKLNMNARKSHLYSWPAWLSQLLPRTISYL